MAFPPVNWWNNKRIKIGNAEYLLYDTKLEGTQMSGVKITTLLKDTSGSIVALNGGMDNAGWVMYSPVSEYKAQFPVSTYITDVPGGLSGTAFVDFYGVDLLGNTGWGKGTFKIDTTGDIVTVQADKKIAKSGDVIIIKAKSYLSGQNPVLTLKKGNDGTVIAINQDELSESIIPGTDIKTGEVMYTYTVGSEFNNYEGDLIAEAAVTLPGGTQKKAEARVRIDTIPPVFTITLVKPEPWGIGMQHAWGITSEELREAPAFTAIADNNVENLRLSELPNGYQADVEVKAAYKQQFITLTITGYDMAGNSSSAQRTVRIDTYPPGQLKNLKAVRISDGGSPANRLTWDSLAPSTPDLAGYVLYRDDVLLGYSNSSTAEFTDVLTLTGNASAGKRHRYYAAGYDSAGNTGTGAYVEIMLDSIPPITTLGVSGSAYNAGVAYPGITYLSAMSGLNLSAIDPPGTDEEASGVYMTYYKEVTYTGSQTGGFDNFSLYSGMFAGGEANTRTAVCYYSTDKVGNSENVKTSNIYVDTAAPAAYVNVLTPFYYSGISAPANADITGMTRPEIISLITNTAGADVSIELLGNTVNITDADLNALLAQLSVQTGVDDWSREQVMSALTNTAQYTELPKDPTYDELKDLETTELKQMLKERLGRNKTQIPYINPGLTDFVLSAFDGDGAGVKAISYRVDTQAPVKYYAAGDPLLTGMPFRVSGLSEGMHSMEAVSEDNVGNKVQFAGIGQGLSFFIVDSSAPSTDAVFSGPVIDGNGVTIVSAATYLNLPVYDNGSVPCGISGTYYNVDNGEWKTYTGPVRMGSIGIPGNAAVNICYKSVDNVLNSETEHCMRVAINEGYFTPTNTPTLTLTATATPTATDTITETCTPSLTSTETSTVTATVTQTVTPSETVTPTVTDTCTFTGTPTETGTDTATQTHTFTITETSTATETATATPSSSITQTGTITETLTETGTQTATSTDTSTLTVTYTRTFTATPTATATSTPSRTATVTRSATLTMTFTPTKSATKTVTATMTASFTRTISATYTSTSTVTRTATRTFSKTPTMSVTLTATATATKTRTPAPAVIILEFKAGDEYRYSASPHPQFRLRNAGQAPVNISGLEIRYWYQYEGSRQFEQCFMDWAGVNGVPISGYAHVSIVQGGFGSDQNRYLKVNFDGSAGILGNGANDYLEIDTRFNKSNMSQYDQGNDWSFVSYGSFTQWNQAAVYYNGTLIWGIEPNSASELSDIIKPNGLFAAMRRFAF